MNTVNDGDSYLQTEGLFAGISLMLIDTAKAAADKVSQPPPVMCSYRSLRMSSFAYF